MTGLKNFLIRTLLYLWLLAHPMAVLLLYYGYGKDLVAVGAVVSSLFCWCAWRVYRHNYLVAVEKYIRWRVVRGRRRGAR